MKEEEDEVGRERRTATFYLWHPCYLLEEALRAFLRCLGVETAGTRIKKEEKSPLLKHDSDLQTPENSSSNRQKSYQAADSPPSTTSQIINASAMERRGLLRPPLRQGSGSQHN